MRRSSEASARRVFPPGFAADLGHRHLKDRGEGAEGLQPRAFAILNALDRADAETRHFGQLLGTARCSRNCLT